MDFDAVAEAEAKKWMLLKSKRRAARMRMMSKCEGPRSE